MLWASSVCSAAELALPKRVEQYARVQVELSVPFRASNPYDPEQIRVDAVLTSPSGRRREVPAYYYQSYDPLFGVARQREGWRLGLTPEEVGPYEVEVLASGTTVKSSRVGSGRFECIPSDRPGFVRTAQRPRDRLAFSNGKGFWALGANLCWGDAQNPAKYLAELDRLAAAGANCVRIWTCPWWLPIEGRVDGKNQRALGRYNQQSCALLDVILQRCEERGLYVILCLEQFGSYQPDGHQVGHWPRNPYNASLGGPCGTTTSFFTEMRARRAFKKRLRYLVARYSSSPALLAWELFNEVEQVTFHRGDLRDNMPAVKAWHREMGRYLQRIDPSEHIVSTSSDSLLQRDLAHERSIDVVQLHVLHEEDFAQTIVDALTQIKDAVSVPVLIGEFGGDRADTGAVSFPRGLYAAVCNGAAGALHWSQDLPDRRVVWKLMPHARRFLDGTAWRAEGFFRAGVSEVAPVALRTARRFAPVILPCVLPYGKGGPPAEPVTVHPDGSTENARSLPQYLHGTVKPRMQRPIVLETNFLQPGHVAVKVNTVSDSARLEVDVDGKNVGKQELPAERDTKLAKETRWVREHMLYQAVYDREFRFPVPAGRRKIRISNTGKDWILLDYVKLEKYRLIQELKVGATAIAGRRTALAYVYGLNETWRAVQSGDEGKQDKEVRFRLHGLADGAYRVMAYETRSGRLVRETVTMSRDGIINLRTPSFTVDLLLRIERRPQVGAGVPVGR